MDYSKFITQLLKDTSKIANDNFGKVEGVTKESDNNQVLTRTDLEIGQYIISKIRKVFPDHNVIDEEAGITDNRSKFTWVIDPIDGTSNFAEGVQLYGTFIGLLREDKPIAGGISLPFFSEIYTAQRGKGTFLNNERIYVSKKTNLLSVLVAYTLDGHQENPELTRNEGRLLAEIALNVRNIRGSGGAFDPSMVAKGKYGAYLNKTSKIWDNVGPQIVIEEAGGIYTDFFGSPMDYSNPLTKAKDNFTFCVGAPKLHRQLQEIIKKSA